MSHEVKIPPVGESITSGTLSEWHVSDGDTVSSGQTLFSLETDKVTQEIEADQDGVIEILVSEGEEVEIGSVVANIAEGAGGGDAGDTQDSADSADSAGGQDEQQQQEGESADADDSTDEEGSAGDDGGEGQEVDVEVPPVGESVSSGTLSSWLVGDGEQVSSGTLIFSLETDKITQEVEADETGVLTHLVEEGEEVEIGQKVATIRVGGGAGSAAKTEDEASKGADDAAKKKAQQSLKEGSERMKGDEDKSTEYKSDSAAEKSEQQPAKSNQDSSKGGQSQQVAKQEGRTSREKMSQLRRKIARHLVNAQQTAAILTTFNEVDMTAVMSMRKELQEGFMARHDVKLGFMSFFVKAVVEALKAVPAVNASIEGDEIVHNHFYDVGCAIGTPKGLVVPVLRDCDQKSFAQIEKDILEYADKAKSGKLTMQDLTGGVFTISNGGVYGSLLSTPILNPPQSGILGMHTIQQRPVAMDGEVVIRPMMYLALSYDHRLVDGKEAVSFLIRIKECLEQPARLLVGA